MRLRKPRRRISSTVAAAAILATASLTTASLATASESVRAERPALSTDPMATWQTDGIVWSMAYANGVVYVGGTFNHVRPPGAKPGQNEVPRTNFAAFNAATGELLPCAPAFTNGTGGTVRALKASPDGQVLYVGGYFGRVGPYPVSNAAAINTANCTLRTTFRPAVTSTVRAIEATNGAVYLGGDFSMVNGQVRKRIAALSPGGALLPFSVFLDAPVRAIMAVEKYGKILVGGDFNWARNLRTHALVALNPSTGAPVRTYNWVPTNSHVKSLANDGTNFYIGAEGNGHGLFDGRIAGRLANDTPIWRDDCLGATQAVVPYKGVLYSASHAHDCSTTPGGFPEGRRQHFLAQSTSNETILHWFPDTNGGLGEQLGPRALVMAGDILWAGGEFTEVNGQPQQGLTRFGTGYSTTAPKVPALSASSKQAGQVTLSWRATWDRDDADLTYRIYRDGVLLTSLTQRSTFWQRPDMHYTDKVAPGSRHQYAIRVTDGRNLSTASPLVTTRAAN